MSLYKSLSLTLKENVLAKKEDPKAYADLAREGLLLGHPVKINGQNKRPDNNIDYHTSIKFFNKEKDTPKEAHKIASKLDLTPPNPKEVKIEPGKIKSRAGEDIYVIKLRGPHAEKIKNHHENFSHMGHPENYKFHPHISVDKETHDKIKASGAKTAHEAGIEFGHAELKQGPKAIHTYSKNEKLAASEKQDLEPLLKPYSSEAQRRWAHTAAGKKALGGNTAVHEWDEATKGKKLPEKVSKKEELDKGWKEKTAGAMMGVAAMSPSAVNAKQPHPNASRSLASIQKPHAEYSRDKVLNAIAQIESSGGKNIHHKPTSMGTAYGKFALMPDVIHDTIRLNPDLKQHKKALHLQGEQLQHYMQDNPNLEHDIAERHLKRLEHHFGQDPEKLSYAYNHGIIGTNRALNQKQNISSHPYVQKFLHAYKGSK